MGLLGNMLDKKNCSICDKELGLLGKRKLEDGFLCKNCANKLSPWFSERRKSSVADIKKQLAYREVNKKAVAKFNPTQTFGNRTKVYIDEAASSFTVSASNKWRDTNPDIIKLSQVTNCTYSIDEKRTEIKFEAPDGKMESYDPKRYESEYDFHVTIDVNSPWFDEIKFKLNDSTIEELHSTDFQETENMAVALCEALSGKKVEQRVSAPLFALDDTANNFVTMNVTNIVNGLDALAPEITAQPVMAPQAAVSIPSPAYTAAAAVEWVCACGQVNTGNFCQNCGSPRPAPSQWVCSCGSINTGNFCQNCGMKRP